MTGQMTADAARPGWLERTAVLTLVGAAGALQFSIAIAEGLLVITMIAWLALLATGRRRFEAPRFFWILAAYAAATLVSTAFSLDPLASLYRDKQLLLFLLVPLVYVLVTGDWVMRLVTVILSCAAASAAIGIVQYGILHYDNLGRRAQGTLGHYMTYSGLLMLVIGLALAKVLFGRRERAWAALVIPALVVAMLATFTRTAAVGVCAAAALLFVLKDFRLLAGLPVVAAIFFAVAPSTLSARFISTFNLKDPTNHDRLAMLREGEHMIRDHPLVGVGPNMVERVYPEYRVPDAVNAINPHLHNVPVQIAAERGLPALGLWIAFIALLVYDLSRRFRAGERFLAAAALATIAAMLAAGLFEYNFGDSEFLMLFLILVTLPFAASRTAPRS
jgi:O-antigen ligase